mgnify:CR=1 FL=1
MHDVGKYLEELVAAVNNLTMEDGEREGGEDVLELLATPLHTPPLLSRNVG